jgi:hypothetical protein
MSAWLDRDMTASPGTGVLLALRGIAEHVAAPSLPPLIALFNTYRKEGGRF